MVEIKKLLKQIVREKVKMIMTKISKTSHQNRTFKTLISINKEFKWLK